MRSRASIGEAWGSIVLRRNRIPGSTPPYVRPLFQTSQGPAKRGCTFFIPCWVAPSCCSERAPLVRDRRIGSMGDFTRELHPGRTPQPSPLGTGEKERAFAVESQSDDPFILILPPSSALIPWPPGQSPASTVRARLDGNAASLDTSGWGYLDRPSSGNPARVPIASRCLFPTRRPGGRRRCQPLSADQAGRSIRRCWQNQ